MQPRVAAQIAEKPRSSKDLGLLLYFNDELQTGKMRGYPCSFAVQLLARLAEPVVPDPILAVLPDMPCHHFSVVLGLLTLVKKRTTFTLLWI
ncbi:hypothetical protein QW71_07590 [Paenibacillus sp. IHB B 3415]|nr:hypothetical protein QW71_07590 [Paenibacillus sp. IHB B 3415]